MKVVSLGHSLPTDVHNRTGFPVPIHPKLWGARRSNLPPWAAVGPESYRLISHSFPPYTSSTSFWRTDPSLALTPAQIHRTLELPVSHRMTDTTSNTVTIIHTDDSVLPAGAEETLRQWGP